MASTTNAPHAPVVTVVEVGPRDGLQNEPCLVPTDTKVRFVDMLGAAGLPVIEATSFVSPKAVPQLADAAEVLRGIRRQPGVRYPVLVPNERGYDRAIAAGADAIALFTAATEAFAAANVGATIDGTFQRFAPVVQRASADGIWVRGYVSVAFGCPYAGPVGTEAPVRIVERLFTLGCAEVSLADTIGRAAPDDVSAVLRLAEGHLPMDRLALHFHDTDGRAIDNVDAGLAAGVRVFDAAIGGLGGCPFAPGAPGNLATERLVDHLEARGYATGVSIARLAVALAALANVIAAADATA